MPHMHTPLIEKWSKKEIICIKYGREDSKAEPQNIGFMSSCVNLKRIEMRGSNNQKMDFDQQSSISIIRCFNLTES